jgi:hypothetical protein
MHLVLGNFTNASITNMGAANMLELETQIHGGSSILSEGEIESCYPILRTQGV